MSITTPIDICVFLEFDDAESRSGRRSAWGLSGEQIIFFHPVDNLGAAREIQVLFIRLVLLLCIESDVAERRSLCHSGAGSAHIYRFSTSMPVPLHARKARYIAAKLC